MDSCLSVQQLSCQKGNRFLIRDICFEAKPQSITALIGPNGSGKSTLIKTCLALWPSQTGQVFYGAQNLSTLPSRERAHLTAYVPQQSALKFSLSVQDVVAQGRYMHLHSFFASPKKDQSIIEEALQSVGAYSLKKRLFTQLSGGEQQRVLLARALATQAPVLFLDEPTSSLDIRFAVEMELLFQKIAQQGKILIIAIHDLNCARQFANKIVLLSQGRLFAQGTPAEVLTPENIRSVYHVQEVPNTASTFRLAEFSEETLEL